MFSNGFLLNEREIWPTGQETWEAIKVVANQLVSEFAETSTSGVVAQTSKYPSTQKRSRGFTVLGLFSGPCNANNDSHYDD